jgi:2-polyprenyl-3-methyl-5-hydroxy-6-metoxy-1,4-benzoquinol methylase
MSEVRIKTDIQNWWADHPMTYGQTHGKPVYGDSQHTFGTPDFFLRVDEEFYSWNRPLHAERPFDRLFPYEQYQGKKVLEIGCGMGTMLMNWARNGAICTGVDLNPTAIEQTKQRFQLHNLQANIQMADANKLPFSADEFDYVYSWGVLHHSPNLQDSIRELMRVLKPGGEFGIMLYNRQSLYEWYIIQYIEGFLHRESARLSTLELNSRYGDGHREEGNPHTWPITKQEGIDLLSPFAPDAAAKILGTDLDYVLRMLMPGLGKMLPRVIIKALARRYGWSLWFHGQKSKS